ncbi:MAG TPA: cytochrome c oxidase assembly factor Coa1 family protein [Pyrinomonadaceae bacterium]|nr:cytochrome c oxidase assembly factor Coa1 family protein [Pyrinomonadaceae bacterium]
MSTKKIVLIVVGIVGVLALLGVLFVVGIGWFVFSTIGNSKAAETARTYLRTNEELKRDIGEVKDFGSFVTGNINTQNQNGEATLNLKVYGERKTVNATVSLAYRSNQDWRVTEAFYDDDGRKVVLKAPYDDLLPAR